jgi:hypothetical protein
MTDREHDSAILMLLGDLKEEQIRTRDTVRELAEQVNSAVTTIAVQASDRQAIERRLVALERSMGRLERATSHVVTGQQLASISNLSPTKQTGLVGSLLIVVALLVKVVEVLGSKGLSELAKLVAK